MHIVLNAGIGAGAEILIPEENLGLDRLLESLQKSKALANHPVLL
jgi:6-phosphofructokinase 1